MKERREIEVTRDSINQVSQMIQWAVRSNKPFKLILEFGEESKVPNDELTLPDDKEEEKDINHVFTDYMIRLGFKANIKGYQYIREAMHMLWEDNLFYMESITKRLYPDIAKVYKTTPSRVERAIRHAIEVAWSNGNRELIDSIFGYTIDSNKEKPTNSEFLALMVDYIRLKGYSGKEE